MTTETRNTSSKNGHASTTRRVSPQPRMGQTAPEHLVESPLVEA